MIEHIVLRESLQSRIADSPGAGSTTIAPGPVTSTPCLSLTERWVAQRIL